MQIVNQEQKVIIDWSILKGVSTEIEDFSITDKLVIFLIGGDNVCDKIPVYGCQSVNTAFSSSVDASGKIHIEIDEGLPTGLYSLKAVWVKNARRVIPNYAEKRNIFSVTDVEDEATNPGAGALKLKLNSHVHSYGYDGLDAYEIAFMTGATELKRSQWVFNDEQVSQSELLRVAAENARVSAENARVSAESGRVSAESGRVSAESSRVNAENQRVQTENVRNTAEGGRVSSEYSRTQSERFREQSESQRVGAEMNRSSNEDGRVLAEAGRVSAESGRVSAENARVSAEEAREGAEAERASMFNTSQAERQSAFEGSESSRQSTFSTNEAARQATASADHTTATNDHTQAGTDHVQAVADHVQAVSDHGNAVLTTQGQGLSDTQKENARGNIGAAKDSDVTDLALKVDNVFPSDAKTLLQTILNNGVYVSDQTANITALIAAIGATGSSGGSADSGTTPTPSQPSGTYITFEDDEMRKALVANTYINTDGDDKISYEEAAAVDSEVLRLHSIGFDYEDADKVIKFNEFQYFTGVGMIPTNNALGKLVNLEEITLPSNLKKLENGSFCSNTKLKKVNGMSHVTEIGSNSFRYCTQLETLDTSNVLTVGDCAFRGWTAESDNLTELNLRNCTSIGNYAFYQNNKIQRLLMPDVPPTFGTQSFGSSVCNFVVRSQDVKDAYLAISGYQAYSSRFIIES